MDSKTPIPQLKLSSGNMIPQIGLGTYEMKDNSCGEAVKIAIKAGYRHIDTASIYKNETIIADALKSLYKEGMVKREDLYITSKISPYEQGYEKAKKAFTDILTRLDTPYVDLVLIHWPGVSKVKNDNEKVAETRLQTWKALEEFKKEGKIKDIGVSNFLTRHLEHLLKNSQTPPAVNQIELHPFCYDKDTLEFCEKNNIKLEAYSPIARADSILLNNRTLRDIAKELQRSVPQIALRWAIQRNFIILPKSKTEKYIKDNFNIFNFELSEEQMAKINALECNHHTCWDPSVVVY